jgi:nitroreductase
MDLFDAIAKRASVRDLQPADVPEADLERILDAGRRAPSGRNRQPVDLIVIRDPGTLRQLATAQSCISDVSLAIAVSADPQKSEFWLEDVAASTENMLLAIAALGYASVWIEGTLLREEDKHKELLGVPGGMRLMVVLPVGEPTKTPQQAPKRPLKEVVHWERYGRHAE